MALTRTLTRIARIFCTVSLGCGISLVVFGQNDTLSTRRLDEVVIKSSRAGGSITRLPDISGVNLWNGKKNEVVQINGMNANLAEKTGRQIFAKIPGVFVYDMDGSGNQINISTRGLDPHRGWEFNIRKNGIITNSDMYGYPASHYSMPMEAVERVEMVRGTGSLQYGAQFGGMVNYVTKRADTTRNFRFENISTAGSYGLLSTYNAIGGQVGKVEYYAYYQKRVSNGYRDNASSSSDAQSVVLIYKPTNKLRLTAEFARSSYVYRIPGPLTDATFNANPRQSTRQRNYFNPDIYVPSISMDWKINDRTRLVWASSAVLGARNSVQFDKPADVVDAIDPVTGQFAARQVDIDHFNSYTSELRLMHRYRLLGQDHVFTSGVQVFDNDLHRQQLGKGTTGSDFDLTLTEPGFGRDLHFKTKNVAVFVENSFVIARGWTLNPGVRIESGVSNMSGVIRYYDPGNLPNSISHRFPLLGVNTQYAIDETKNIYAGWSQSYRPVIFKDIIPASTYERVDKSLSDAKGYTVEAGYRGRSGKLVWDLGAFAMSYRNRLGALADRDENNNYFLYRTNIGNSMTIGAEIFGEYSVSLSKLDMSLFTSTALFSARYTQGSARSGENNMDISGNKVESVPDVITRNGLSLSLGNASLTMLYSYTSSSFADALNTVTPSANGAVGLVPSYGLLDFAASYKFSTAFTVKASLNNLTNEHYFTKRPSFYPGPGVWSSDGRTWNVSAAIRI